MRKATFQEAKNGSNNEAYITPYLLANILKNFSSSTPTTVGVKVNSTNTVEPDKSASVINIGDDVNVSLVFNIPKGEQGDRGDTGDSGVYVGDNPPSDPSKTVWVSPNEGPTGDYVDKSYVDSLILGLEEGEY